MQSVKLQRYYRILHTNVSPLPYNFSSLCLHVAKFEDAVYCVYIERKAQIASTMSCSYLWDIHVLCIHPVQLFVYQGDLYILLIAFHPQMLGVPA